MTTQTKPERSDFPDNIEQLREQRVESLEHDMNFRSNNPIQSKTMKHEHFMY
jgi:hypothetical protein